MFLGTLQTTSERQPRSVSNFLLLPLSTVKDSDEPIVCVSWSPTTKSQLLVASSQSVSLLHSAMENVSNLVEPVFQLETKPLLLARWVVVPSKYKVESPNNAAWTESFSLGRKFQPDVLPPPPPPHAKSSFISLAKDHTLYWTYLETATNKWSTLQTSLGSDSPLIKADVVFASYTSARFACVSMASPTTVYIYDVVADFASKLLSVVHSSTSKFTVPSPCANAASKFFLQTRSDPSTPMSWHSHLASLLHKPSFESLPQGASSSPLTPKTPAIAMTPLGSSTNSQTSSANPQSNGQNDDPLQWSLYHDLEQESASNNIEHLAFDPYDLNVLFLVWNQYQPSRKASSSPNASERRSYLHKWRCNTHAVKVKCPPLDLSKFISTGIVHSEMDGSRPSLPIEIEEPTHGAGFNSVSDFDDMNLEPDMNGDYNDLWGFDTKADSNAATSHLQSSGNGNSNMANGSVDNGDDPFAPLIKSRDTGLTFEGPTHGPSTSGSMRQTHLIVNTWECAARSLITASNNSIHGSQGRTASGDKTATPSSFKVPPLSNGQSSNGPSTPFSSHHRITWDCVTQLKCGKNVITMTLLSGSTLLLDMDTLDIVLDYCAPHTWASSSSLSASSTHTQSPMAPSTASTTLNASDPHSDLQSANPKKRAFDAMSPDLPDHFDYLAPSPLTPASHMMSHLSHTAPSVPTTIPDAKRAKMGEFVDPGLSYAGSFTSRNSARQTLSSCEGLILSSGFPVAASYSPNQACVALLHSDMTVRVVHLAPLLRYRAASLTSHELCTQVTNMLELAILRRITFWDVLAMLLALPEPSPANQDSHLHRGVLILLSRSLACVESKLSSSSCGWWRQSLELVKSGIFRSSPDMTFNFLRSQAQLSLRRTVNQLENLYRCSPWLKKILNDASSLEHPELKLIFSTTHDLAHDKARVEKETGITIMPQLPLRWLQAFTNWVLGNIASFQKKVSARRTAESSTSASLGISAFIATDDPYATSTSGMPTPSHAESPAIGSNLQTPNLQTPNPIHTPGAAGAVYTPSGSNRGSSDSPKDVHTPHERFHKTSSASHSRVILALPPWVSQLPVLPETLEELLLIIPDSHVDMGLLWSVDVALLNLLKEALLYFSVAIHLDPVHGSGKEYLKVFPEPSYTACHNLLTNPVMSHFHAPNRYMSEDWINQTIIPSFYGTREIAAKPSGDAGPLDLLPSRLRFLELNFFPGSPLDPSAFPVRNGQTFLDSYSHDRFSFWHSSLTSQSANIPVSLAPDTISLNEVKGEYCRRCTYCNRLSGVARNSHDGAPFFTNSCPICQAPWMIVRNPHFSSKRAAIAAK